MKRENYHCTIKQGEQTIDTFDFIIEEGHQREAIAAEALMRIKNLIKGRLIPQTDLNSSTPNEDLLVRYGYSLVIE